MATFISSLDVSVNVEEERALRSKGFEKVDADLNKGTAGKPVYIWYKRGSEPITRVQFSFCDEMGDGLKNSGFTKVDKNLNTGAGGDVIYLWYFKGTGEFHTPIVEVDVTTDPEVEAQKFGLGWERLNCDLTRRAKGNWIYAWVKREKPTYICDTVVTANFDSDEERFRQGYIRVDEDYSRGRGDVYWFLWYRQTTDPCRALKDLKISTNDKERQALQQKNYQRVSVDLKEGAGKNPLCVWYKKEGNGTGLKACTLLLNTAAVEEYTKAGVIVIEADINEGTKGCVIYQCLYF